MYFESFEANFRRKTFVKSNYFIKIEVKVFFEINKAIHDLQKR